MSVLVEEDNAQIVKQAREEGVFEIHQALRMAINRAVADGDGDEMAPELAAAVGADRMVVFEEVGDAGGHGQVADLFAAEISNGCLQVGDTRAERKCGGVDAAEDAGGEGRVAFHDRFQVGGAGVLIVGHLDDLHGDVWQRGYVLDSLEEVLERRGAHRWARSALWTCHHRQVLIAQAEFDKKL